jgi:hypothetical protein
MLERTCSFCEEVFQSGPRRRLYLPGKTIEEQLQTLKTALQKHIELTTIQQDKVWQRKKGFRSLEYEDEADDDQRLLAIHQTREQSHVLATDQSSSEADFQILSTVSVPQGNT